jgi:hypothetical protein
VDLTQSSWEFNPLSVDLVTRGSRGIGGDHGGLEGVEKKMN